RKIMPCINHEQQYNNQRNQQSSSRGCQIYQTNQKKDSRILYKTTRKREQHKNHQKTNKNSKIIRLKLKTTNTPPFKVPWRIRENKILWKNNIKQISEN